VQKVGSRDGEFRYKIIPELRKGPKQRFDWTGRGPSTATGTKHGDAETLMPQHLLESPQRVFNLTTDEKGRRARNKKMGGLGSGSEKAPVWLWETACKKGPLNRHTTQGTMKWQMVEAKKKKKGRGATAGTARDRRTQEGRARRGGGGGTGGRATGTAGGKNAVWECCRVEENKHHHHLWCKGVKQKKSTRFAH